MGPEANYANILDYLPGRQFDLRLSFAYVALIAGPAVQGLGASGMSTMVNVIICDTFSLRDRGVYLSITSIVWAVGTGVGPVIGGIFTTRSK